MAMKPFVDSTEHVMAELGRVDLLIRARVAVLRRQHAEDENFRGLYVSEQEVDGLLQRPLGRPRWLDADDAWLAGVDEQLEDSAGLIEGRRAATRDPRPRRAHGRGQGLDEGLDEGREPSSGLALDRLREAFGLSRLDLDVLLVALAVELDLRYEKLYAYLQDDVTRKRPSVELALQLLAPKLEDRFAARERFHAAAPLISNGLVQLIDDAAQPQPPLLARYVKVDERIVRFLLAPHPQDDALDARLLSAVRLAGDATASDGWPSSHLGRQDVCDLWPSAVDGSAVEPVVVLRPAGAAGDDSLSLALARAMCDARGIPLLVADARAVAMGDASLPNLVQREALLRGAAVYWQGLSGLDAEADRPRRDALLQAIDAGRAPSIVSASRTQEVAQGLRRRHFVVSDVPAWTMQSRQMAWAQALSGEVLSPTLDLAQVSQRFRLPLDDIGAAAVEARRLARQRAGVKAAIEAADVLEACRRHSCHRLGSLARKVVSRHGWDDLVLPPDRKAQLRELCNQVRFREQVFGVWGFGAKLSLGKGLSALFSGPSGTGKTMAAGIIAHELGLDLYKIDLSTVISKYIGETEKNLAAIFDEAERTDAILFFDEADALFGKRSEVRDSHDRYANIEVAFLLQRMEEYEGVAILATNIRKNMDEAFMRRLHFTVEFPVPDARHRLAIWEGIWPAATPRDASLDLAQLAERYELSGGNIRNVALAAAFMAAAELDGGAMQAHGGRSTPPSVGASHVLQAIQREYRKSGKLIDDVAAPTGGRTFS